MEEPKLFDYIKMISQTKEIPDFDEHFRKTYNQFMVNRFFSLCGGNECCIASVLNKNYGMSNKSHFMFLHTLIRKGKRYTKWPKQMKDAKVKALMDIYQYSYKRASEVVQFISDDQLADILSAKSTGGVFRKTK